MNEESTDGVTRRRLLIGGAIGAALALAPSAAFAAPSYAGVPKLPYEVARTDTQTTRIGKKKYESIDIVFSNDRTRLFVPHVVKPGPSGTAVTVVWFYHAFGSTYTSLSSAYLYSAMKCLDRGWVCVGPNFGGDQWVNARAIAAQGEISRYMAAVFNIKDSLLRANSGGGSLMSYAYGTGAVPQARGMYLANATYDMEELLARDPSRVKPAYDNDSEAVAATNPARLDPSVWTGARVRALVSQSDVVVPPDRHGVALVRAAAPAAVEASLLWHEKGHVVPDIVHDDMIAAFLRWKTP